jgi:hypothetical protein
MAGSVALESAVATLAHNLAAAPDNSAKRRELVTVYDLLLTDGASYPALPSAMMESLRESLRNAEPSVWNELNTRPRTAFRLIAAGEDVAAWELLTEGVRLAGDGVEKVEPAHVHVDGERVFAWLPGFRDPRFGVPDDCYELSDDVKAKARIDTAELTPETLTLAGTAFLTRSVRTGPQERVALVLSRSDQPDVVVPGIRHRRPDLVSGGGTALRRHAWSGWSVTVNLLALPSGAGRYRLSLQLRHGDVQRTCALGGTADGAAQQEGKVVVRRRRTEWRLDTASSPWSLVSVWQRWPKPAIVRGLRTRLRHRVADRRMRRSQPVHR